MLNYKKNVNNVVSEAANAIFEFICQTPYQQIVIGVENSNNNNVIGYGKLCVSTDYHDPIFESVNKEQMLWLQTTSSTVEQIKYQISNHLSNCQYLPARVLKDSNVVVLNDLYNQLRIQGQSVVEATNEVNELQESSKFTFKISEIMMPRTKNEK